ncbi:unnamed protein product [Schistosoma curassoni]|uniref:ACT_3 domain-containing protein n=1 Tax=Schistosoma curassoni TaxID=6186 RepID=A0A183JGZ3_9TREM|nr:unnamed protein product [Schistosoma curassoni]
MPVDVSTHCVAQSLGPQLDSREGPTDPSPILFSPLTTASCHELTTYHPFPTSPRASEPFQYLDRFLTVLHLCLKYVLNKQSNESLISHNDNNNGNNKSISQKLSQDSNNNPNNSNNTNMILTFHPNYLAKSCGGLILFAASRLTNSEVGELRLEKSDLCLDFQCILMFPSQLKKNSNTYTETHCNDTDDKRNQQSIFLNHAKIILSSLDYTHSTKLSRLLLTTAVNSGIKVSHNLSFYFLCSSNEKILCIFQNIEKYSLTIIESS